ncbi:MAG: hypothetical protein ABIR30_10860 [Chitinophagaceae bacterium]
MRSLATTIVFTFYSLALAAQPAGDAVMVSKPLFIPVEKTIFYRLGDRDIQLKISQYGNVKDIVCINLHDNETTSVQAARAVLEEKGGTLIKIENKQQRIIRFRLRGVVYSFDPNRIFSRTGIEQTLIDNRRTSREAIGAIEKFAQRMLDLIPTNHSCIIALHNNTEEAFSVKSYLPGSDRQFDARAVYKDSLQDVDDIAFTTDSLLYQRMADQRYNSIWQDNQRAKRDGSLSIYCGERSMRYINIETQHGRVNQYIEMLEKLLEILALENKRSPDLLEDP